MDSSFHIIQKKKYNLFKKMLLQKTKETITNPHFFCLTIFSPLSNHGQNRWGLYDGLIGSGICFGTKVVSNQRKQVIHEKKKSEKDKKIS